MAAGIVKFFNSERGYGFIEPDGGGKDVFVHASGLRGTGMDTLTEGQRVTFETENDPKGLRAINLKRA